MHVTLYMILLIASSLLVFPWLRLWLSRFAYARKESCECLERQTSGISPTCPWARSRLAAIPIHRVAPTHIEHVLYILIMLSKLLFGHSRG